MNQDHSYRNDIDGLRAVAILAVLLFHLGSLAPFPVLPNGYLGVDVFFVISGYLIASVILKQLKQNSWSAKRFYQRRIRRLLPAFILMILTTATLAWWILDAQDLKELAKNLYANALFISNFRFATNTGYFDAPTELNPLIHTWSLAVEEQFYFIFPCLLVYCWFRAKAIIPWLFALLMLYSALTAFHWLETSLTYNQRFYLPTTRAWELLAGALLIYYESQRLNDKQTKSFFASILFIVSLALLIFCMLYPVNPKAHPGPITLFAVICTLILLWSGQYSHQGALKILTNKFMIGIGLISYSLYLWHQPMIAYLRHWYFDAPPWYAVLLALILTFIVSYLSWRWIEQPARSKTTPFRKVWIPVLTGWLLLITIATVYQKNKGFPDRFLVPEETLASFARANRVGECIDHPKVLSDQYQLKLNDFCVLGQTHKHQLDFILVGDSHAFSVIPAFDHWAQKQGLKGVTLSLSACSSLTGLSKLTACDNLANQLLQFIQSSKIGSVFMINRWLYYWQENPIGRSEQSAVPLVHLSDTIANYLKSLPKETQLYLFEQVPEQKHHPRKVYHFLSRKNKTQRDHWLSEASALQQEHLRVHKSFHQKITQLVSNNPNLNWVETNQAFCATKICMIGTTKLSYYFDEDHLSKIGNHKMEKLLENYFKQSAHFPQIN